MPREISVVLAGISGYGESYLRALLAPPAGQHLRLLAVVDPAPERCRFLDELKRRDLPVYAELQDFYAEGAADLAIVATPIHWHAPLTCLALEQGSSVLCEKPLTATIQEAHRMAAVEEASPGFAAIGYQWSFSAAIQALKQDIRAGRLGRPVRFKTLVSWPRPASYYGRNDWAGKCRAPGGSWVLDSAANNATAHYLHNIFYLLGDEPETSARPVEVQAELYRANPIENHDTAALRALTRTGTEILFYTTHAVPSRIGPVIHYEFEEGVVYYEGESGAGLLARFRDGRTRFYGDPDASQLEKLWQSAECVRSGRPPSCGIRAASSQTLCINGVQDSVPEILPFPEELVEVQGEEGDSLRWVRGLQDTFIQCYDQGILPSERGNLPWTRAGRKVDLREYRSFPSAAASPA